MKANAPEKIYLNPLLMEDGESIVRRCTFERQRDSQIEYIRKDAFIEKAVDAEIVEVEDNNNSMYAYTNLEICTDEDLSKICKARDKAKVIIIKQNGYESSAM